MKILRLALGVVALLIGILGVVVPLLPTTPFLLVAAFLFAKDSPRLHHWLMSNRYLGQFIDNYINKRGIRSAVKARALLTLWLGIVISLYFVKSTIGMAILMLVMVGVTAHILSIRSREE